jgi:uncharacterized protein YjbI with pentapeptide repeats
MALCVSGRSGGSPLFVGALLVGVALALAWPSGKASAACTDPPDPGVDWSRCAFDNLTLTDLDIEGAKLRDSSFLRSDLTGSNLAEVEGYRTKFISSTLRKVVFDGAKLLQADFTKADLTGASFVGADLRNALFFKANLSGADLTDAKLKQADLTRADFSGATWVDGERICREGSIGRCF